MPYIKLNNFLSTYSNAVYVLEYKVSVSRAVFSFISNRVFQTGGTPGFIVPPYFHPFNSTAL
jgi:hypothetical protein